METIGIVDIFLGGKYFTSNTVKAGDDAASIKRRIVQSVRILYPDMVGLIGHMNIERVIYSDFNALGFDVTAIKLGDE